MDDAHAELVDTRKKKVPISKQPGALPPVSWSPDRPRPKITPSIWSDAEAEEIAKYVDWHRNHPHTVTPRKAQMTAEGEVIGGKFFHEDDASLVYSHIGYKPNPLPEEFQPRSIGLDCDTDEVSVVASRIEYQEHLLHNEQYDDPWFTVSVKDQLETSHVDGSHTTRKSKPKLPPATSELDKEIDWLRDQYADFQGGGPKLTIDRTQMVSNLALQDKALIHGTRVKKSPWTEEHKFSRFTAKGTALNDFKRIDMERRILSALKEYEEDAERLRNMSRGGSRGSSRSSALSPSGKSSPMMSGKSSFIAGKSKKSRKSNKVAPMPVDPYVEMKAKLGGTKKIDRMADDWVKLGLKVSKSAQKQKELISFDMDLYEACEKLRVYKLQAALVALEDGDVSDVKTPDEEPLFLHMFNKALKMDAVSGHVKDFDHDSNDRKKAQKILQLLLQYKANINDDKGKDQLPPLQLAVVGNNLKMITWCIENKCDVEQFNIDNTNAMMLAAKYGHVFALAALIRGGCNIQAVSEETGRNALHSAAMFGQTRAALFLIRVGVNKKILDVAGKTAAQIAFDSNYQATAQAISAFAEAPNVVGPQLEYIVEQEKKREERLARRGGRIGGMLGVGGMMASSYGEVWQYVYKHVTDACKSVYTYLKTKLSKRAAKMVKDDEDEEEAMRPEDLEVFKKSLESLPDELKVNKKGEIGERDDVMPFFVEEEGY